MQSLFHYAFDTPAIPNTAGSGQWSEGDPFTDVESDYYWTATTAAFFTGNAWLTSVAWGEVRHASKLGLWRVWPVRGGQ